MKKSHDEIKEAKQRVIRQKIIKNLKQVYF
jgi:hypothetical protein